MNGLYIKLAFLFCLQFSVLFSQDLKIGLPVGHTDAITNLFYSPSGKYLASLSKDQTAKIWDIESEKLIANLPLNQDLNEFGFVSDSLILIRGNDNRAHLYSLKNKNYVFNINYSIKTVFSENHYEEKPQKLNLVKLDSNKEFVVGIYENANAQFNNIADRLSIELPLDNEILDAKTNALGSVFALRDKKDRIVMFDPTKSQIFANKFNNLSDFLLVGQDVLILFYEKSIKLWSIKNNTELKNIKLTNEIIDFKFDDINSKLYFLDAQNFLNALDIDSGEITSFFKPNKKVEALLQFEKHLNKLAYVTKDSLEVLNIKTKIIDEKTVFTGDPQKLKVHIESQSYAVFKDKQIETYSLLDSHLISVFKNQIDPVLFASIDPINRRFYVVNNKLNEYTLALDTGKFKKMDSAKTTFLNTPYNYSLFKYNNLWLGNLDSISDLCSLNYSKEQNVLSLKSSLPLYQILQNFGTRIRLNRENTTEDLMLFTNNNLRVGTQQGYIAFQHLRPNMGWSAWKQLGKHDALINSLDYFNTNNDTFVLSTSEDGSVILWSLTYGKVITYYAIGGDPEKWVHLHPSGLFDASTEAMKLMYWTKNMDVVQFSQLKDRYWLPGLWQKVMNGERLPDIRKMSELKLQPHVEIVSIDDDKVEIHLTKREGGYGAVTLFINGKEAISDIRPIGMDTTLNEQNISVSIKNHPYLFTGANEIKVNASSQDGFVQGRGAKGSVVVKKKTLKQPQFFCVVVGVGDYANKDLNLKYTVNDAKAISKAMKLGAENLFGKDRTHMYSLTSNSESIPTKENIKNVFKEISEKAHAEDVITVYLSGHGITWGGDFGDFYFLTSDATATASEAYNDPVIRKNNTISTSEWVSWIKDIPALKQVMIIDACGSGKAVDNLISERDIESSQIKAIDRMKDRTGMFIISGCAADAVSYEASIYSQGLLTYSILQGMKGAALKENKYVDVFTIMAYARETVPKLAEGIGGIQEPQLLIPKSGGFDIGFLETNDKNAIPLANPKTVFVRSTLLNTEDLEDSLGLTEMLNNELSIVASKGKNVPLVYFDSAKYPNACKISGGYTVNGGQISIAIKLRCGKDLKTYILSAMNKEELIQNIVKLIVE